MTSTLGAGFNYDSNPTFTSGYGSQALFNGIWSGTDGRTGDWAFHILDVAAASSTVPEPGSIALLGLGLAGLGFATRRRRKTA